MAIRITKDAVQSIDIAFTFQGEVSGYTSGGDADGIVNTIDKFSFSSDGNASDVGDLTLSRSRPSGQSSTSSGYSSGGRSPTLVNTIDKFPFAADGNATDVGDLTRITDATAGQSSTVSGYASGGSSGLPVAVSFPNVNIIDKFPFATDANATDVGDLTQARRFTAGQSSTVSGYTSGGNAPPSPALNRIDKFPFASDANATTVGNLSVSRWEAAGQSSIESGYSAGGNNGQYPSGPWVNTIDKFPFSSDANATDVGDLTQARGVAAGQSSTASGYTSGGFTPITWYINTIDKFPFASNANATDVGDLSQIRGVAAGQQV
jgi:hypothetical protein